MEITISEMRDIDPEKIIELYKANNWSSADKPNELYKGLKNSHSLFSALVNEKLVGIGNAISDGKAIDFYSKVGFVRAGQTQPMWIYKGEEH